MIRFILLLLLSSSLLTSCKTIQPVQPSQQLKEKPQLEQVESTLFLPIKLNLKPYFTQVEKELDKTFKGQDQQCEGISYDYYFERSPIEFSTTKNSLNYEVAGKYSLKLNFCSKCTDLFSKNKHCITPRIYASCGVNEPMRKVAVGYATTFKISPDLKLVTSTDLQKFETVDPCEITLFNYDATNQIKKEVTTVLKKLEQDIDQKIGAIDIKKEIQHSWNALNQNIALNQFGFLNFQPKTLSIGEITFKDNYAFFEIGLNVQPKITSIPEIKPAFSKPIVSKHQQKDGFDLTVDILAKYDSLSSILTQQLKGQKINIKSKFIVLTNIEINSAQHNQLNFKVDFNGFRSGILYLNGTPNYDVTNQTISFPDLEFDLATKDALLKSAKWLFNSKITQLLRAKSNVDIKGYLDIAKKELEKQLNNEISKGVQLKGKVHHISIEAFYPSDSELILRAKTNGKLNLEID